MPKAIVETEFLTDLRKLHREEMSCLDFKKKYLLGNASTDFSRLPDIAGNLAHYVSDEDLRAKDPEYRKMQMDELLKLIHLIENGAPEQDLTKIHFLGSTNIKSK